MVGLKVFVENIQAFMPELWQVLFFLFTSTLTHEIGAYTTTPTVRVSIESMMSIKPWLVVTRYNYVRIYYILHKKKLFSIFIKTLNWFPFYFSCFISFHLLIVLHCNVNLWWHLKRNSTKQIMYITYIWHVVINYIISMIFIKLWIWVEMDNEFYENTILRLNF